MTRKICCFIASLFLCCVCNFQTHASTGKPSPYHKVMLPPNKTKSSQQLKNKALMQLDAATNCATINWATWTNIPNPTRNATGTIDNSGDVVNVTMTANYDFGSTPSIYNYSAKLSNYPATIPNNTVPETEWSAAGNGTTTMCFSKTVTNPVLLLASLGSSSGISSKLTFDIPYVVVYDAGGMVYNDKYSVTGTEGYAIIMFPGSFNCVTVHSTTPEYYTNITWGLKPQPFNVTVTPVSSSCAGVTLTASGGASYKWDSGDSPFNATNTFHTSGTYVVTATDATGCQASVSYQVTVPPGGPTITGNTTGCGSVTLTATGGSTILWDGGDTPNSGANTFHTSGTYHVTVSNANGTCGGTAPVVVTVNTLPTAVITETANVCGQVTLTASGGASYQWSGGNSPNSAVNTFTQSGTYTVTVTNAAGCTATTSKNVVVRALPVVGITGNATDCQQVTLTASGGSTYVWDGGDTPGSATNTFRTSGTYTVTVTNTDGCSTASAIPVNVLPVTAPAVTISAAPAGKICSGQLVTFTPNAQNGGSNPQFTWFQNGVQQIVANTYTSTTLADGDKITCQLKTSATCATITEAMSNELVEQVSESPTVSLPPTGEYYLNAVQLIPVVNGNIVSYAWTPATGLSDATISNPIATPADNTTYTLTVINDAGCQASASINITVRRDLVTYNTFTPNGDGINDTWVLNHVAEANVLTVDIYNRYGTRLFHSDGYPKPWDGTYSGKPVPAGSYYYVIHTGYDNRKVSGFVLVVR